MGATLSSTRARRASAASPCTAPPHLTFAARCDEVTDHFLKPVCEARAAGELRSVTIDCRKSGFDEVAVERANQAAGGRLVLQL